MRNPFKDFIYFTREERRGVILLIAVIVIVLLAGCIVSVYQRRNSISEAEQNEQEAALKEYETFIASLQEKESNRGKYNSSFQQKEQIPVVLAPFNPNTADSLTFRRLGLPAWMAKNILRYRSKGGKFRKATDFQKMYGLTEEQYATLSPYLYIAPEDTARNLTQLYTRAQTASDSIGNIVFKYPAGTVIDLNRADTTELKKIPGIGSGIARLISGYRQRLGGFYHIDQLKEIHLDASKLYAWFSIQPEGTRRINLNRVSVDRLRSHPYFNFYQAKAIVEYRKKKGVLNNLKPFTLYEEFTAADLERMSHYVCFETTSPSFK